MPSIKHLISTDALPSSSTSMLLAMGKINHGALLERFAVIDHNGHAFVIQACLYQVIGRLLWAVVPFLEFTVAVLFP